MYAKETNGNKDAEGSSEGPVASLALVVRMPIARMPELVRLVAEMPETRIVYQRISAGRLLIEEEGDRRARR